jgi:hypothetical protein
MITINDLSASEAQYLRDKWASEKAEIDTERANKLIRLERRLETQGESAVSQANLEADIAHAEGVRDILVANGADPTVIAAQQAVVAGLQEELDSFGVSSSYVSDRSAMLQKMELDELELDSILRAAQIAAIDVL